ncbi:enoyl-CoA hydratase/isomerase family protein [Candidatus Riflebacteria bacterium]
MEYKNILLAKKDFLATITINRPDVLNALNSDTMNELEHALDEVAADKTIRVLLFTGAGKSFVAGADIKEFENMTVSQATEYAKRGQAVMKKIAHHRVPVIAVVNGFALGGGCELACACDIRLASSKAKFGQPEVNLGIIPGYGGTQRLTRLIGKGKAFELCVTGEMIKAEEAHRIGIVNHVYEPDNLMAEAEKMAGLIAKKGPVAVGLVKQSMGGHLHLPLADALDFEARLFGQVFDSEDKIEGISAFLEKRKPEFKGK